MSPEQVARAIALVEDGRSQRYAARVLNLPETNVRRAIRRYWETGLYTRRRGSGRPRVTGLRDDRFILMHTLRNRFSTAAETSRRLRAARGVEVSAETVRRRLQEMTLRARRPARRATLTAAHRRARLSFAREHRHWTVDDWRNVLFTDESRYALFNPDGRLRVYRRPGERYAPCTTLRTMPFGGGSVMVWGGISLEAKTELHIFNRGRINADVYIRDILQEYVVPYAPYIGDNFILMHDNARPHTAECVTVYLREVGVSTLRWPAYSPDLNPIEHIWDELERRVKRVLHPPNTLTELKQALNDAWEEIPQEVVREVIQSMPRRIDEVIQARGDSTSY